MIWDRQVENFWETSWVTGVPREGATTISHLTAARKNLRNISTGIEPGVKCSLMGSMQEISGFFGRGNREKQKHFWNALQKNINSLELKRDSGERLCAIAIIKRLFPHVVKEAVGNDVCDELCEQESWPSTAFFAASPWLKEVKKVAIAEAKAFAKVAINSDYQKSERQAAEDIGLHDNWAHLDGPAWFASSVRQKIAKGKNKSDDSMLVLLNKLYKKAGGKKPVPYYAMLLMDGDSMGKLLAAIKDFGSEDNNLSESLGQFSGSVQGIVNEHDGRTIYAGGDDVMAILPANTAFKAADLLSQKYAKCFNNNPKATLSGAIVFAHWKFPLRQVLREAHHLLDDVAKDGTGRDALAIGIMQGSGLNAVWSAPWNVIRGEEDGGFGKFSVFIEKFTDNSSDQETTQFNASFLYTLRDRFSRLLNKPLGASGSYGEVSIDTDLMVAVANAEYRRRMSKTGRKKSPPEQTLKLVKPLVALSRKWFRDADRDSGKEIQSVSNTFSFDGWRVARFLKQVKDGKVNDHE
jgi:CRISPR-associated protein Cmr2